MGLYDTLTYKYSHLDEPLPRENEYSGKKISRSFDKEITIAYKGICCR